MSKPKTAQKPVQKQIVLPPLVKTALDKSAFYVGLNMGLRIRRGMALKAFKPLIGIGREISDLKEQIIFGKIPREEGLKKLEELNKKYEAVKNTVMKEAKPHLEASKRIYRAMKQVEEELKRLYNELGIQIKPVLDVPQSK